MNLEERLKTSEAKGYISVQVESKRFFFFIESKSSIKVEDIVKDSLGTEYKVNEIINKSRISAEEV